jgi:hypothetical protein
VQGREGWGSLLRGCLKNCTLSMSHSVLGARRSRKESPPWPSLHLPGDTRHCGFSRNMAWFRSSPKPNFLCSENIRLACRIHNVGMASVHKKRFGEGRPKSSLLGADTQLEDGEMEEEGRSRLG